MEGCFENFAHWCTEEHLTISKGLRLFLSMERDRKLSLPSDSSDWAWPATPAQRSTVCPESEIFTGADTHDFFSATIPSTICLESLPELDPVEHNDDQSHISATSAANTFGKLSAPGTNANEQLFAGTAAPEAPPVVLVGGCEIAPVDEPTKGKSRKREQETGSITSAESDRDSPTQGRAQKKQRGLFARLSPQIQLNAREGQKHWGQKVQVVRAEWAQRSMGQQNPHFASQIAMCARLHIKSQHECILRQLQLAAVDGMIVPAAFSNDETRSFLGWTGFEVVKQSAAEFRSRIEGMFATPPNTKTLNNTVRRAGLIPEAPSCWGDAWEGNARFVFDANKRAQYGRDMGSQGEACAGSSAGAVNNAQAHVHRN